LILLWLDSLSFYPKHTRSLYDLSGARFDATGFVFDVLNKFPTSAHPMTQLTAGIMALQVHVFTSQASIDSVIYDLGFCRFGDL
jgi:hypothetical protein